MDELGQFLLASNYTSGSVAVFPILDGGLLGEATDRVEHQGHSVNPNRQKRPHAHSAAFVPGGRRALVADLGVDKIFAYELDRPRGKLRPNDPPWTAVRAGSGPRHLAFHPAGRHVYAVNELDSTVTAFAYDPERGVLTERQSVPALPEGYRGENYGADIHVAPSGRFLYASNRGHDSIAFWSVDPASGRLTAAGHESTRGKTPRNFAMDRHGVFLLVANQDSDNIVTFRVDARTGALRPSGEEVRVPSPACLTWV